MLLGCGNMGGALLKAWAANTDHDFTVADPAGPDLPDGVTLVGSVAELGEQHFDYLIVALKPQLIDDVLPDYLPRLKPSGTISSIAAGYSAAKLAAHAPGRSVIRIMPNLPAVIGKGVSGLYAHGSVPEAASSQIEQLASCSGDIVWVDSEDMLDRLTAVAGSGPGYVFEILRAYVEAAEQLGFSGEDARNLVLGTVRGTLELALDSDLSLEQLRNNVTSKGGTTAAGLNALNGQNEFSALIRGTLEAAYGRAVELR
ncbi:pyrroline-5-carboxylate reductase [uncultured Parasphingorhabdus sp.]|uniref:pyrroline-5-carboxylate reductase family protein n=1 Tax=uncultured Parasphingorhabdus sp. TaxID=2709694 RepID=UPI002D1E38C1|nr:pyrroline-5-carboxylate reductase [uncultured Parasphingorhabdus sp.]